MVRIFKILFIGIFGGSLLLMLLGISGFFYILWEYGRDLPDHSVLREYEPLAVTRVHSGDGALLAEYVSENRIFVPIDGVPELVKSAFLSAEDKNFRSHYGVDFFALVKAIFRNFYNYYSGRRLIGASTITQQVAKNFLIGGEATLARKIREAILSFRIEHALSKDSILELYLNEIYLGYGSYGVAVASLNYFNKSLEELLLHEVAFLAALPKGPNNYHPVRRYGAAVGRRNWVLSRMYEDGVIGYDDFISARSAPLVAHSRIDDGLVSADYFLEEVRKEASSTFGTDVVNQGGLSVRTTLRADLQDILVSSFREGLLSYDRRHGYRGALASVDGDVLSVWESSLRDLLFDNGGFSSDNPYDWDVGVVLGFSGGGIDVGLLDSGDVGYRGHVSLSSMRWVRRHRLSSASKLLSIGDVIYVELLDSGDYVLRQVPEIEGAGIILDPHSGRVLAMVGGWDFSVSEFNRATQAYRQPGSAFKPFVYLAGLESGLTPISPLLDAPFVLVQDDGEKWRPANYKKKFYGLSPMYLGIEKSRNLMTVRLAQSLGMDVVSGIAERFRIQDSMPELLSMALGAGETNLLSLTSAYGMLVNGGRYIRPTLVDSIQDRYGNLLFRHDERDCASCSLPLDFELGSGGGSILGRSDLLSLGLSEFEVPRLLDERKYVTTPQAAYQVVTMLERVISDGTGRSIRDLGLPLAGKTGTTNDSYDTWFIGFSADLVVGIFVGYDFPKDLGVHPAGHRESGSSVAAPIFKSVMGRALDSSSSVPFRTPNGISFVWIDPRTNQPANRDSKRKIAVAFTSEYVSENYDDLSKGIIGETGSVDSGGSEARGLY